MADFGNTLKRILDERGISQKWLAEAAQTNEATISRYITGSNKNARLDILVDIAKALNVSTDYLLGMSEVERYDTNREEQILVSCFRKANSDDIDVVWSLFKKYMTPSEKASISMQSRSQAKIG